MKKLPLFLGAALLLTPLTACERQPAMPRAEYSVVDTAPADFTDRVQITNLKDWSYFNADGSYTDNCLAFLRNLVYGTSEFPELAAVKIGSYRLLRDPHEYEPYQLYFTFDVTESALAALPCGHYEALLSDVTDCYLDFKVSPVVKATYEGICDNAAAKAVTDWIDCDHSWDTPGYGNFTAEKAAVQKLCNYYVYTNGKTSVSDFLKAANADFGLALSKEEYVNLFSEHDFIEMRAANSIACYDVTSVSEDGGIATVYVQFYADCNKWISSSLMCYTVENGVVRSAEYVSKSPYTPYGLHPTF